MKLFSQRYNYTKPRDVLIREDLPQDIANSVCSCYDELRNDLRFTSYGEKGEYELMNESIWIFFLHRRQNDYYNDYGQYTDDDLVATYILDDNEPWFKKLDLIEYTIDYLSKRCSQDHLIESHLSDFRKRLNFFFKDLGYAYRIVDNEIVEISSEEEIQSIEGALSDNKDNIRQHLSSALSLYAKRPIGDYRNSIKESISAVEAFCREKTGENTLGKALNKMNDMGLIIPDLLKTSFEKLYAYTNQPEVGVRHALMDQDGSYIPDQAEALFMLVSCSAFLNYLNIKLR